MTMSNVAPATPTSMAASRDRRQRRCRIDAPEEDDRGHHQHADEPEPRAPLAEAAEHRNANGVDQRRPQELEVVGEERQRECRDRALPDPVLREPRGERGADHREGEAGRDAEERSGQRRRFDVRAHAFRQPAAPPKRRCRAGEIMASLYTAVMALSDGQPLAGRRGRVCCVERSGRAPQPDDERSGDRAGIVWTTCPPA